MPLTPQFELELLLGSAVPEHLERAVAGRANPMILYIVTRADRAGSQTHLLDLALSMRDKFDVRVAAGEEGFLSGACRESGIPFYLLPHLQRTQTLIGELQAFWETRKLLQQLKPDLIHAHTFKAGFIGRMAGRSLGIPSVYTLHAWLWGTPEMSRFASILGRPMERLAAKWCERITTVSAAGAQLVQQYKIAPPEKVVTIHNGIPDCPERARTLPNAAPVIIMVARFTPGKNHGVLLRAFANLPRGPRLRLVGDGETRAEFEILAQSLGIQDRVEFLGERHDVPRLLADSDIFVLSSVSEMFPISILEAMRAGLPVVSSNVGGVSEAIIDGQTGLLVPSGSIEAMTKALTTLTQDGDLRVRLGRAGRQSFVEKFLGAFMEDKFRLVYTEVLRGVAFARSST
jgi:glycosyltransferase involved in cell wall biosynthesis